LLWPRRRTLKCADRLLEGQTLSAQKVSGGALAIANDSSQHDRSVDLGATALARGSGRRFQDPLQIRGDHHL
jgi:hypothetical protein